MRHERPGVYRCDEGAGGGRVCEGPSAHWQHRLRKEPKGLAGARPDPVCFADDYFARGGLWALERLGLRAPEDVKVVSLSNYGNAPFYPRPLTRFENNHFDYAAKTVRAILRYIKTGRLPGSVLCNI